MLLNDALSTTLRIEAGRSAWPLSPVSVWRYRYVFYRLLLRDFQVRYRQTVVGVGWAVMQPLITMLIFTFTLGHIAKFESGNMPYSIFCLAGLVLWTFFSNCLLHGGISVYENSNLIRQAYFPREFLPLTVCAVKLIDLAVGFALLLVWSAYLHPIRWTPQLLLFPIYLGLGIVMTVGAVLFVSALCAQFPDVRYALPFLTQILFFATPIVYALGSIQTEKYRWVLLINPLTAWIDSIRQILFGHYTASLLFLGCFAAMSVGLLAIGCLYFRNVQRSFSDTL